MSDLIKKAGWLLILPFIPLIFVFGYPIVGFLLTKTKRGRDSI